MRWFCWPWRRKRPPTVEESSAVNPDEVEAELNEIELRQRVIEARIRPYYERHRREPT